MVILGRDYRYGTRVYLNRESTSMNIIPRPRTAITVTLAEVGVQGLGSFHPLGPGSRRWWGNPRSHRPWNSVSASTSAWGCIWRFREERNASRAAAWR